MVDIVLPFATAAHLPPELRNYVDSRNNAELAPKDWIGFAVGISFLVSYLVTSVGLYKFKAWAKKVFLPVNIAAVLIALFLTPLYGPHITTGWELILNYLNGLVNGGILFLVYLSPVGHMFPRSADV